MKVLDLFSGIGAFSLGLQWAGMETVAFCETDEYCRGVLADHWDAVFFDDVRTLTRSDYDELVAPGAGRPDLICGGFPCQDISLAGAGAGLAGERSGLWREYARIVGEFRPEWAIVENVPALRHRGLDQVLGSLAALGYDAWWDGISAAHLGAPHRRDRLWLVAHTERHHGGQGGPGRPATDGPGQPQPSEPVPALADTHGQPERQPGHPAQAVRRGGQARLVAGGGGTGQRGAGAAGKVADAHGQGHALWESFTGHLREELAALERGCRAEGGPWHAEPEVGRVVDGVALGLAGPGRNAVARALWEAELKALGNSLVPWIPFALGRAILATSSEMSKSKGSPHG